MNLLAKFVRLLNRESTREIHSADGKTFIERVPGPRRRVWEVVVNGVHLATFFRREDARVFIRDEKFKLSRFGREVV